MLWCLQMTRADALFDDTEGSDKLQFGFNESFAARLEARICSCSALCQLRLQDRQTDQLVCGTAQQKARGAPPLEGETPRDS